MQMKPVWFLVFLILWALSPAQPGRAEDPKPADWSGAGGLSVSTDDDSRPCAIPPSYGQGTKNPACTPLVISGTETPTNGDVYAVTGGIGPFTWSASGPTITPKEERSAEINVDGACGSGTVSVTDTCGNSASMQVRLPSGQWVLKSNNVTYPVGYDYLVRELVVGDTKTQSYYSKSGVDCSPQWYLSNSDSCVEELYCSYMPKLQPGSIGCSNISICGNTPTIPYYRDLPGTWWQEYYASGTCVYWWNSTFKTWKAGWWGFEPTDMARIYAWECPSNQ